MSAEAYQSALFIVVCCLARLLWPLVVDLGLSKLAYFITRVAVNETLADDKPLTLFAPTNDAFNGT